MTLKTHTATGAVNDSSTFEADIKAILWAQPRENEDKANLANGNTDTWRLSLHDEMHHLLNRLALLLLLYASEEDFRLDYFLNPRNQATISTRIRPWS